MESRGKQNEHGSLEKRVTELVDTERKLRQELEELKTERDSRMFDF